MASASGQQDNKGGAMRYLRALALPLRIQWQEWVTWPQPNCKGGWGPQRNTCTFTKQWPYCFTPESLLLTLLTTLSYTTLPLSKASGWTFPNTQVLLSFVVTALLFFKPTLTPLSRSSTLLSFPCIPPISLSSTSHCLLSVQPHSVLRLLSKLSPMCAISDVLSPALWTLALSVPKYKYICSDLSLSAYDTICCIFSCFK